MITSNEIASKFIQYFESKGHSHYPGSSVIPNDKSLLFTNSGMVQFKNNFSLSLSEIDCLSSKKVCTIQDCIRAGGKHNDLEDVGLDSYHHTFFRMLGNWSFGDYFKELSVFYAYDFLVNILCLDVDRLYVSIYDGTVGSGEYRDSTYFSKVGQSVIGKGAVTQDRATLNRSVSNTRQNGGDEDTQNSASTDKPDQISTKGDEDTQNSASTDKPDQISTKGDGETDINSKSKSVTTISTEKGEDTSYTTSPASIKSTQSAESLSFIDTETSNLWSRYFPKDRILHFPAKENFWEMADTGPCGPCTEIHYDQRVDRNVDGRFLVNKDHPDVIEIWNIVFIEYYRNADRSLTPLVVKSVDTGMGLERVVRIVNDLRSNYQTDVFANIIRYVQKLVGQSNKDLINGSKEECGGPEYRQSEPTTTSKYYQTKQNSPGLKTRSITASKNIQIQKNPDNIDIIAKPNTVKQLVINYESLSKSETPNQLGIINQSVPDTHPGTSKKTNSHLICNHSTFRQEYTDCYDTKCLNFFKDTSYRVISDHARTLAVCMYYQAKFDSQSRGYVVRRILRRAIRYCSELGIRNQMGSIVKYAGTLLGMEINPNDVCNEELMFMKTLEKGKKLLATLLDRMESQIEEGTSIKITKDMSKSEDAFQNEDGAFYEKDLSLNENMSRNQSVSHNKNISRNQTTGNDITPNRSIHITGTKDTTSGSRECLRTLSGKDAFTLFDTYGFPIDLTQLMCSERGFRVDIESFEKHFETHKNVSKKVVDVVDNFDLVGYDLIKDLEPTEDGWKYSDPVLEADLVAIFHGNKLIFRKTLEDNRGEETTLPSYRSEQNSVQNATQRGEAEEGSEIERERSCLGNYMETDVSQADQDLDKDVVRMSVHNNTKGDVSQADQDLDKDVVRMSVHNNTKGDLSQAGKDVISFGLQADIPYILIFNRTNFYSESGGQVSDTGTATIFGSQFYIKDVQKYKEFILHTGYFKENIQISSLNKIESTDSILQTDQSRSFETRTSHYNEKVLLRIDTERRSKIAKNHTATHILNKVLKNMFKTNINQCGSQVNDRKFRFDFSFNRALTNSEVLLVETAVNEVINRHLNVSVEYIDSSEITLQVQSGKVSEKDGSQLTNELNSSEFRKTTASSTSQPITKSHQFISDMFAQTNNLPIIYMETEKYPKRPRLIHIHSFSKELCGGTHCKNTSEIQIFKIISEQSISSNTRRIIACTFEEAQKLMNNAKLKNTDLELSYLDKIQLINEKNESNKQKTNEHKEVILKFIAILKEKIKNYKLDKQLDLDLDRKLNQNISEKLRTLLDYRNQFAFLVEMPLTKNITKDLNQMATIMHKENLQGVIFGLCGDTLYFCLRGNECLSIANDIGAILQKPVIGGNNSCSNGKGIIH